MDPKPDNSDFADLGLCNEILEALDAAGYREPTPIQAGAIPPLLEGRDFLGVAQTGTGKTAAFALPILQRLHDDPRQLRPKAPRVLVLAPTRELASQIAASFDTYGRDLDIRSTRIFGGVGKSPQISALRQGVDVVVATPGRLLDLMGDRHIDIRHVEGFVLDEADRMLDMGFIHDVKKIIAALPKRRQTLLLSATMPEDIVSLSSRILHDPVRVEVTPPASTVELILQMVYFVERPDKRALLSHVLEDRSIERVLVFSRTKHGANRIAKFLQKWQVTAAAIHGDKGQGARERALEQFRAGEVRVLVATDIAARGIDVKGVTHVINFDLPNVPEHYVHRIGRTARAGRSGVAISFCDVTEREYLKDIETLTREPIEVVDDHPYRSTVPMGRRATQRAAEDAKRESRRRGGGGRGGRSGGGRGRGRGRGR